MHQIHSESTVPAANHLFQHISGAQSFDTSSKCYKIGPNSSDADIRALISTACYHHQKGGRVCASYDRDYLYIHPQGYVGLGPIGRETIERIKAQMEADKAAAIRYDWRDPRSAYYNGPRIALAITFAFMSGIPLHKAIQAWKQINQATQAVAQVQDPQTLQILKDQYNESRVEFLGAIALALGCAVNVVHRQRRSKILSVKGTCDGLDVQLRTRLENESDAKVAQGKSGYPGAKSCPFPINPPSMVA